MLDFEDTMTLIRENPVDGNKQTIYENINCDIQINERKKEANGQNSDNSEIADYFIFVNKKYKDLKIGDLIKFEDYFGEEEIVKVMSRDFIDYESVDPFIEILCKLK